MEFFKTLATKPWSDIPEEREGPVTPPQRVALRFFLGVVGILFFLFMVAYYIRMELNDWRPMPESPLLWLNTLILFASSIVLQLTSFSVAGGKRDRARMGLVLGGVLTLGFVFGQLYVWKVMMEAGYIMYNNPANSFFYILTGIHGLHLLGGLWVWTWATIRAWTGTELKEIRLSVDLCTVYWHFLLVVWLVLFALLSYT